MSLTAEDFAEQLKQAKERGLWEGGVTTKLDMLISRGDQMNTYVSELRGLMQLQGQSISELRAGQNSSREDLAELKDKIKKIEAEYVERKDLDEALRPLKALADRLNNWAWQVALAGLSGSALALGAGYGILKITQVIP